MKLGVCIPQDDMTYDEIKRAVVESEKLGFDSVWFFDHLHSFPNPDIESFLECWTLLSALAEATHRIRLGSLVLDVQYRNPALLAKMAATLDNINKGRLELGIGAGGIQRAEWAQKAGYTPEYRAYGMDFPEKPGKRIARLREAVQVMKKLWREDKVTFDGKHYKIQNALCYPKPYQKPHPPLWIAGTGEQLTLKVVAELADGCNFAWNLSPKDYGAKLDVLRRHCEIAGKSYESISKSLLSAYVMGNTEEEVRDRLTRISEHYRAIKGYVPYALRKGAITGTADECIRKLNRFIDAGVDYFMLVFPRDDLERSLERFARTVMPLFR